MKRIFIFCLVVLAANIKGMHSPQPDRLNPDFLLSNNTLAGYTIKKLRKDNPEFLVEKIKGKPSLKIIQKNYFEKNKNLFEEVQHEFIIKTKPSSIEETYKKIITYKYKNNAWEVYSNPKEKQVFWPNSKVVDRIFQEAQKFESTKK